MDYTRLRSACLGLAFIAVPLWLFASGCPEITRSEQQALIEFARKKYRVPDSVVLRLVSEGTINELCYERIKIISDASSAYFQYSVSLSPDHVLLIPEIIDTRVDPLLVDRKRWEIAQTELGRDALLSAGPIDAPVTFVLFSDFQCPYCRRASETLRNQVLPAAGSDVRLVFKHFPLSGHNWAGVAAKAAACVGAQDPKAFWKVHDYLFQHQQELEATNLLSKLKVFVASMPGVDAQEYDRCVDTDASARTIARDIELGRAHGVNGTPFGFLNGRPIQISDAGTLLELIRQAKADYAASHSSANPPAPK